MRTARTGGSTAFTLEAAGGSWILLVVADDNAWRKFGASIGSPAFCLDPLFATAALRDLHAGSLTSHLKRLFLQCTAMEWGEVLDLELQGAAVNSMAALLSHSAPQFRPEQRNRTVPLPLPQPPLAKRSDPTDARIGVVGARQDSISHARKRTLST